MPLTQRRRSSFQLLRSLAKGSFGEAIFARTNSQLVVIKKPVAGAEVALQNEIRILSILDHPNIVVLLYVLTEPHLGLVLSYADGGDLFEAINSLDDSSEQVMSIQQVGPVQLSAALDYLHNQVLVVHRDIKPENVLIFGAGSSVCLKLTDFGTAKQLRFKIETDERWIGSDGYRAPEVDSGAFYEILPTDIYSFGKTLLEMLNWDLPNDLDSIAFADHISVSEDVQRFVHGMLKQDPRQRPNISTVLSKIQEFFQSASSSSAQMMSALGASMAAAALADDETSAPAAQEVAPDVVRTVPRASIIEILGDEATAAVVSRASMPG